MTHELLQNELLRYLDAMMVSREPRLASVTASILSVLWYVICTGAFPMIVFLWNAALGARVADYSGQDRRVIARRRARPASLRIRSNRSMTW